MRFWKYGAISSRARSTIFSRRMMLMFSIATAQQTGWPDQVNPCANSPPFSIRTSATRSETIAPPSGW